MTLQRRTLLTALPGLAMGAALLAAPFRSARAAGPIRIGVLIPGSKSDKGWMESGYDGLVASEKKYGDKIKVQMIENINYVVGQGNRVKKCVTNC